ncbi:MAG TPA: amino acid ABC transporter substrate-binding protein [Rhodopila sp.]|uniref:amino acid ABC transporter substrate-binding protein n=1 Tax=Rhodopila sp. TaxID=2480087 RepID=UPI002CD03E94|nr:amino acid ABC transporter substrate-binding protein [Rhodopila sp.]HVY16596.1 amino acid ABC transporter substrate-binding protein [Rhodopila sp.]
MIRLLALLTAACFLCAPAQGPAWAEEGEPLTGTLKTIADRGTILIGYREAAPPFAFLNPGKQPVGFSVDLCHGIATDVARTLNRDLLEPDAPAWQKGVRIVYVPVAADERLAKLVSSAIDLECGSTTDNAERERTIAFSPVFFLAGTKLMVPLVNGRPSVATYRGLAGKTVVVGVGTTNAAVLHRLAKQVAPPMTVREVPSLDDAYAMLGAGTADAFASDDILLAGLLATKPDGRKFAITGDYLSFEPYAIGLRRNDPAFAALVHDSFVRMASEGTLYTLYKRWLMAKLPNGQRMNMPISPQLAEMYRALGQPD